jgi:parallel beta-helix repeat protein
MFESRPRVQASMFRTLSSLLVFVFLSLANLHAATFYCDPIKGSASGDGSSARPWKTIEETIAAHRIQLLTTNKVSAPANSPVKAGDTVLLRSGWHGVIRIPAGYNSEFITIAAAPGHTPAVGAVEIGEGTRWRIKGLTVSPSLAPEPLENVPRNLVTLGERGGDASSELIIEDCFVYTVLDASQWTAKDWVEKPLSGIWLGRNGRRHVARNNYILNTRFGINLCAPEVICEGNVVENFSGDGIRVTRDGQVVQYNVIKNSLVGSKDGDDNHDDGIQIFLFNRGTGTVRDVTLRGNLILNRERDDLPFQNGLQGIGGFDGPLVGFKVEQNVISVNHYHGLSLYDAQGCTVEGNVCFSRWPGRMQPWVMLGQKKKQSLGNTVRNNFAHSFSFKADAEVIADRNEPVTETLFHQRQAGLLALINSKFGEQHPVAKRPRVRVAAGDQGSRTTR